MVSELLKNKIAAKAIEMVECAEKIGKQDFFEINIKHINGELITKMEFSDKDKVMNSKS